MKALFSKGLIEVMTSEKEREAFSELSEFFTAKGYEMVEVPETWSDKFVNLEFTKSAPVKELKSDWKTAKGLGLTTIDRSRSAVIYNKKVGA